MIKIDGVEFAHATVSLKRSFSVLDDENSGRLLNGDMTRGIIGTYYNYSCEISSSFLTSYEYDTLYELISEPKISHTIEVPYAQSIYIYQAYITNGEDELKIIDGNLKKWDKLTFNFIAMSPRRRPIL